MSMNLFVICQQVLGCSLVSWYQFGRMVINFMVVLLDLRKWKWQQSFREDFEQVIGIKFFFRVRYLCFFYLLSWFVLYTSFSCVSFRIQLYWLYFYSVLLGLCDLFGFIGSFVIRYLNNRIRVVVFIKMFIKII